MKAIYVFIAAFAAFFVMLLAFTWLSGVSDADVYAYHETDFDTDPTLLKPGAIVAVSDSGQITPICSLKKGDHAPLTPNFSAPPTGLYYNKLAENLPAFVGVVDTIKSTFGMPVEATNLAYVTRSNVSGSVPKAALAFKGRPFAINSVVEYDKMDEPDCEKRITQQISNGYRVCTVFRVLNELLLDDKGMPVLDNDTASFKYHTVAITLADKAHFMQSPAYEAFGIEYNENAKDARDAKCNGSSLPWSVRFRRFLDVIGRVEA